VQTGALALFQLADQEVDGLIDQALENKLTVAELEQHLEQTEARLRERVGDVHHTRLAFKGPVATARITLLDQDPEQPLMKRELALPIKQVDGLNPTAQFAPDAIQSISLPGPVYRSSLDGLMELTAEQVPSRIRIVQNDGRTPLYTSSVDFRYPKVESRRFMEMESERMVLKGLRHATVCARWPGTLPEARPHAHLPAERAGTGGGDPFLRRPGGRGDLDQRCPLGGFLPSRRGTGRARQCASARCVCHCRSKLCSDRQPVL
jgi:hypothetical protein